jgi:hypothetical protein
MQPQLQPVRVRFLESCSSQQLASARTPARQVSPLLAIPTLFFFLSFAALAQTPASPLPEAPQPNPPALQPPPAPGPCQARREAAAASAPDPAGQTQPPKPEPCPPLVAPLIDWYARFLNGPQVKALTPAEKAHLAVRNLLDPFNAITILGNSAIYVAANSHSAYGPGMTGFGKNVGVSYTQDMTGEFFGTFLIPSLVHQDPHYHRLPNASMKRRIAHALYQVVWTQGDDGRGMVNYANLAGFAIDDAIGNLYVPGQQTNFSASASRYATGLAAAPIDNFITEFLPDVARRIHVRIVLVQRIINQVARTESAGQ